MIPELRALAKSVVLSIPTVRERYFLREILKRSPCCAGNYSSFAEALAALPPGITIGFDHSGIAENTRKWIDTLNPRDYPVLYWLSQILPNVKRVFELGGNTGQGFYVYNRYLSLPPDLHWMIYDVPEALKVGREIANERSEGRLEFTDQLEAGSGVDLYVTFGTLQYIEKPFAETIGALAAKPRHLVVSRVPYTLGKPYVTIQNNGGWFCPYKVDNRSDFIESIQAFGYKVVADWETGHPNDFLLHPDYSRPGYYGFYFRLE